MMEAGICVTNQKDMMAMAVINLLAASQSAGIILNMEELRMRKL
jgi:hypothetical protein